MKQVSNLLEEFSARKPIRTGSLVITLFGDVVSPHGGAIWLGSLIRILEPFGLNHRQIRTAVFRLVKEDWLAATQVGRRSYYSFTEAGRKHYEKAARRIILCRAPALGRQVDPGIAFSLQPGGERAVTPGVVMAGLRRAVAGIAGLPFR